ncbi:HipA family kinase [Mesorhizobium sp.]|uniref:HipA family kinase n=1 Tax=Mesorhizobium sp. TaxID=1871066 RepID=UPI000FE4E3EC|nr:HipA family kinase [Mesorhizobium sp.]RWE68081.1 MAG: hypothetical protein EOS62_12125 [Mesorhizobium sp.]
MAVEIIEIVRRSTKGMTEPFICRGADDAIYFVKGHGAGRLSLVKEWICGNLAKILDLPIAPFEIAEISEELMDASSDMRLSELGTGPAFGSRQREFADDILFSQMDQVPLRSRRDILIFDRWIRNYDRTLSDQGGNPNLLWAIDEGAVVMIDHNSAFDQPVDGQTFAASHIFGKEFLPTCHDAVEIAAYRQRLDGALGRWQDIVSSVPRAWLFLDALETMPINFNFDDAFEVLCQHREEGFWSW